MKTLLAFAVLFFWGTLSSAGAQQHGWSGTMTGVQQLIVDYGDELNLTDEQKTELIARSIERQKEMQRQRTRAVRQRTAMRGERRGDGTRSQHSTERRHENRSDRTGIIQEILTDEQLVTLREIRTERIEKQHELNILRNQLIVQKAGIEENKADQVLKLLNSLSEHQKELQIQRVEQPGQRVRDAARDAMNRYHNTHDDLKKLLTAAEYENLRRTMRPAYAFQQGRMDSRPAMRSR
jgi:hypothetical protein